MGHTSRRHGKDRDEVHCAQFRPAKADRNVRPCNLTSSSSRLPRTCPVGGHELPYVYETTFLPREEQLRVLKQISDRIRTVIKDANKQIKETKRRLGIEDAKGVLMLVNDGNTVLELDRVLFVLAQAFRTDSTGKRPFSGIDRLIYLTHEMPGVTNIGPNSQVWVTPLLDPGDTSMSPFLGRVQEAWLKHLETKTGAPIPVFEGGREALQHLRFRDEGVPLNRPNNDLLAHSFRFGAGTEQELIDALRPQVNRLRESDFDMVEMMRMLITPRPEWNPNTMFPAFQRLCHGFGVRSAVAACSLVTWPGQTLLSMHICKLGTPEGYDPSRVMPNGTIPFRAEIPLIERLRGTSAVGDRIRGRALPNRSGSWRAARSHPRPPRRLASVRRAERGFARYRAGGQRRPNRGHNVAPTVLLSAETERNNLSAAILPRLTFKLGHTLVETRASNNWHELGL